MRWQIGNQSISKLQCEIKWQIYYNNKMVMTVVFFVACNQKLIAVWGFNKAQLKYKGKTTYTCP